MEKNVSVIIPTFNRKAMLAKAVASVLTQSYPHLELVVVDDGSDDGTAELIAELAAGEKRRIVYLHHEVNQGPAAARNRGMAAASHGLIAFLDSDDWFDPHKIAIQVAAMQANPDFLISHTQEIWYRSGVLLNQKKKHEKRGGDIFDRCLSLCAVSMSTVMLRRRLIDEVGLFAEQLRCCEDYDFWLRAAARHRFLLIDQALTFKEGGRPDQVSSRHRLGMDRFRIASIEKLLETGGLTSEQREIAQRELARKCRIYGNGCIKHGRAEEGRHYLVLPEKYRQGKGSEHDPLP